LVDFLPRDRSWAGLNLLVVSPTPTHPQDHGNRKRIFEICAELKRRGARIEFVHYPGEHDWRHTWPTRRDNEMRAAWDSYQLVPPSRGLHESSRGPDHLIDEWADPSLGHFIAWACRVRAYDAVIVNYTWMSFCFEAVPKGVFRICDTHDVFGGRRALLEANGIEAEFFHTTKSEEARGLARADLVWAIKAAEESYFRDELGLANCLTMLHADPERGWWRRPPSTDGWLRAGVIGARNNVNRRNLEAFLAEALPAFEAYMAPVKILIAGGLSEHFEGYNHPNVEAIGRVAEIEDFYRGVDVVIAPMRFSTGLKIKVSEALASGAPVLAHAHAMEGYPSNEPMHQLASFREMALALATLSFDRTPLTALARRSRAVCQAIRRNVSDALDETRRQVTAGMAQTICVVAPAEALDPRSLLHDHLLQALDYLRFVAPLALYLSGRPPEKMEFDLLQRFSMRRQVFVEPELAAAMGERAPEFWTPIPLGALLDVRGYQRAYLMTDCRDDVLVSAGKLRQAIVRHDAIRVGGGDADGLIDSLRNRVDLVLVSAEPTHLRRWQKARGVSELVYAPFRRTGSFESLGRRASGPPPKPLLLLARPDDLLAESLLALAARLGWPGLALDPADPATRDALLGRGREKGRDPLARLGEARLLVDLTEDDPLADTIGEAALRIGLPRLKLQRGQAAIGQHSFDPPLKPTSILRLFTTVADCAGSPAVLEKFRQLALDEATSRFASDAGWTVLWGLMTKKAATSDELRAVDLWR
jgi:glycosyltransferase involved in cell wall biosynthesis